MSEDDEIRRRRREKFMNKMNSNGGIAGSSSINTSVISNGNDYRSNTLPNVGHCVTAESSSTPKGKESFSFNPNSHDGNNIVNTEESEEITDIVKIKQGDSFITESGFKIRTEYLSTYKKQKLNSSFLSNGQPNPDFDGEESRGFIKGEDDWNTRFNGCNEHEESDRSGLKSEHRNNVSNSSTTPSQSKVNYSEIYINQKFYEKCLRLIESYKFLIFVILAFIHFEQSLNTIYYTLSPLQLFSTLFVLIESILFLIQMKLKDRKKSLLESLKLNNANANDNDNDKDQRREDNYNDNSNEDTPLPSNKNKSMDISTINNVFLYFGLMQGLVSDMAVFLSVYIILHIYF